MPWSSWPRIASTWLGFAVAAGVLTTGGRLAADEPHPPPGRPPVLEAKAPDIYNLGSPPTDVTQVQENLGNGPEALFKTPVSGIHPGAISIAPVIHNPVANDPKAAQRGMQYFTAMNCVGCHAPNGGGGMGPSLSNRFFQYGSTPANIYLSIAQGRPNGMPAWGDKLPPSAVWDLVAYIRKIANAPQEQWGTTISATSPSIEQVPAEYTTTDDPWSATQPFSYGQKPEGRNGSK